MADDFSATSVDREAINFDEPQTEAPAPLAPEAGEPEWAGALPVAGAQPTPPVSAPPPEPPPPEPTPTPSPPVAAPVVDPLDLATTTHRPVVEVPDQPYEEPIDQLAEDKRVAAAGRAAGWKPGSTSPNDEDRMLKVGLWVVAGLVGLLLVGLCIGLGATVLTAAEESVEIQE